jgi:hypothetical protein
MPVLVSICVLYFHYIILVVSFSCFFVYWCMFVAQIGLFTCIKLIYSFDIQGSLLFWNDNNECVFNVWFLYHVVPLNTQYK